MELKDSGARRGFETGAMRDIQDGKGRCDLLPLDIIGDKLDCSVFFPIYDYIYNGDTKSLWDALALFREYVARKHQSISISETNMILISATHYELGAQKYKERNWELGIPIHCYIDSGVRHLLKVVDGWEDEPHENAFVWNMLGAIWTHKHFPELRDLPFNQKRSVIDGAENRECDIAYGAIRSSAPQHVRVKPI